MLIEYIKRMYLTYNIGYISLHSISLWSHTLLFLVVQEQQRDVEGLFRPRRTFEYTVIWGGVDGEMRRYLDKWYQMLC